MSIVSKIVSKLIEGIATRGSAIFVVSGGSSPSNIYAALVAGDYDGQIDWSLVTITLVDDRLVPKNHADSNQKLIQDRLLQGPISEAKFLPITSNRTAVNLLNPFDVILLGMGLDGHFASLFPSMVNDPSLDLNAEPAVVNTGPLGTPRWPRISMNLSMIIQARLIVLLAMGREKEEVLAAAKMDNSLPVHHLITQTSKPVLVVTC